MNNANYVFREPKNEPVYSYAPGTPERKLLQEELDRQYNQVIEIPLIIGGKEVRTGSPFKMTICSCLTNGSYGYFPMESAYAEGGYEAKSSIFASTVAADIVAGLAAMLNA